eukprot:CAMPEP_0184021038 /NCGR_PEP_ID=MMETSP0954-20121128/9690_1 /TAXON_ID=627963 /ORGANISM="Aplanochytrium sp, Strain PBS07" /LENGTH=45 /DNA_ID= /DNA_START= /DNA_END= /DNA_ORIENTATION=
MRKSLGKRSNCPTNCCHGDYELPVVQISGPACHEITQAKRDSVSE